MTGALFSCATWLLIQMTAAALGVMTGDLSPWAIVIIAPNAFVAIWTILSILVGVVR